MTISKFFACILDDVDRKSELIIEKTEITQKSDLPLKNSDTYN